MSKQLEMFGNQFSNKPLAKVVNLKKEKYDVFIGRGSVYGNPYTHIKNKKTKASIVVETRKEAIEKYKKWFYSQPKLMERAKIELSGKVLGCFCKPLACHGEVLCDYVNKDN